MKQFIDYINTVLILVAFTLFILICANGIGPTSPNDQLTNEFQQL